MRPLLYIVRKSAKNKILELKKKPAQLIAYMFFIVLLVFCFMIRNKGRGGSIISQDLYGAGATCLILLFTVPDLLTSLNKGSTFFRGADVNLVFTAPVEPQNVLIYGFIKQMYTIFVSMLFLLFQLPNLMRFNNIKSYAVFIIIGAFFILVFFNSILKVLIYSITSKDEEYRNLAYKIFKTIGIVVVCIYFLLLFKFKSPIIALNLITNSNIIAYIPVYGWIREILMAAIYGVNLYTMIYVLLTISVTLICTFILYKLKADYYEDVLQATEKRENDYKSMKSKSRYGRGTISIGKVRKIEYAHKGEGAKAIFYRHILECRKTAFGFINFLTFMYIIIGITAGFFMPESIKDLRIVLGIGAYLLLIFSVTTGRWQQELSRPYIFMIPAGAAQKVLYSTIMDNIKNFIDGSVLFVITGFLFKSDIITIILCIITYISIGTVLIYGGVLTKRFFGDAENIAMMTLIRMITLILIIIPGTIGFITISIIFNNYVAYIVFILYNLIFSGVILLLSKGIFENIELS